MFCECRAYEWQNQKSFCHSDKKPLKLFKFNQLRWKATQNLPEGNTQICLWSPKTSLKQRSSIFSFSLRMPDFGVLRPLSKANLAYPSKRELKKGRKGTLLGQKRMVCDAWIRGWFRWAGRGHRDTKFSPIQRAQGRRDLPIPAKGAQNLGASTLSQAVTYLLHISIFYR